MLARDWNRMTCYELRSDGAHILSVSPTRNMIHIITQCFTKQHINSLYLSVYVSICETEVHDTDQKAAWAQKVHARNRIPCLPSLSWSRRLMCDDRRKKAISGYVCFHHKVCFHFLCSMHMIYGHALIARGQLLCLRASISLQ